MDNPDNFSINNGSEILVGDTSLALFTFVADLCLAAFSLLNLVVNFAMLLLCIGFIRNGCQSSSDDSARRPHYGLHFFIFHCILSSVLLGCIGTMTNVGYLFTTDNIYESFGSEASQVAVKKILDFVTYALFNVSHLNFVLLLNVDKLLYILRPLHYYQLMNRQRVCLICLVTWLVALAMASPSLTYLDMNSQIRQEAILFAMCVVCPACFDLLSAIIVSTLVYRIQVRDSQATLSARHPVASVSRRRLFSRRGTSEMAGTDADLSLDLQRADIHAHSLGSSGQRFFRHCRVFLVAFTPIIWTCVTSLPYTSTMMHLFSVTDSNEEFYSRWTDPSMFKVLRALGCLYVIYFTGVPIIIVFFNQPYRKRITTLASVLLTKYRDCHRRVHSRTYTTVIKADQASNANSTVYTATGPALGNNDGHTRQNISCTDV